MDKEIILDGNKVRCAYSFNLLGHWFEQDNIKYYIPLNKK